MHYTCLPCRFTASLVYYGLNLSPISLGFNDHVNFLLMGLAEFPANFVVHGTLNRLGRRVLTVGSLLLAGAALLLTMAVPEGDGMC